MNDKTDRMKDKAKEIAVVDDQLGNAFLQMVERVSTNPDVDADKLEKVLDMQMRVLDRQARDEFYVAMNEVQGKLPAITRDSVNPQTQSRYSALETIVAKIRPIYTLHGFSTSFTESPCATEDHITVTGTLRHKAGHSEEYHVTMPLDMTGIKGQVNKTRVHATGSTFTYARRYLTCLMFDIATGDDIDGNAPDAFITEEQQDIINGQLKLLSDDDKAAFWKKARVETTEELLAHRFSTYIEWITKHMPDEHSEGS